MASVVDCAMLIIFSSLHSSDSRGTHQMKRLFPGFDADLELYGHNVVVNFSYTFSHEKASSPPACGDVGHRQHARIRRKSWIPPFTCVDNARICNYMRRTTKSESLSTTISVTIRIYAISCVLFIMCNRIEQYYIMN